MCEFFIEDIHLPAPTNLCVADALADLHLGWHELADLLEEQLVARLSALASQRQRQQAATLPVQQAQPPPQLAAAWPWQQQEQQEQQEAAASPGRRQQQQHSNQQASTAGASAGAAAASTLASDSQPHVAPGAAGRSGPNVPTPELLEGDRVRSPASNTPGDSNSGVQRTLSYA